MEVYTIMDNKVDFKERINQAFLALEYYATQEALKFVKLNSYKKKGKLCKPLRLFVDKTGSKTIVRGDKCGVLATFVFDGDDCVAATKSSKMTFEEYLTYTDDEVVETLMDQPAAQAAYGESAMPPDGLVPIENAIEICSRGTEIHDLIVKCLNGKLPRPKITTKEADALIAEIDNPDKTRMLRALSDALDSIRNSPDTEDETSYDDFLIDHSIGTDKIIHALCVSIWTISHDKEVILHGHQANRASLRELIVRKGPRYTEAVGKIVRKMNLAGVRPWVLLKVWEIRENLADRPMFYTD